MTRPGGDEPPGSDPGLPPTPGPEAIPPWLARAQAARAALARWRRPLGVIALLGFIGGIWLSARSIALTPEDIAPGPALAIFLVLGPLYTVSGGIGLQLTGWAIGVRVGFRDALTATALGTASEVLPIPGGAVMRGAALMRAGAAPGRSAWAVVVTALLLLSLATAGAGAALLLRNAGVESGGGGGSAGAAALGAALLAAGGGGALALAVWIARRASPLAALAFMAQRVVTLGLTTLVAWAGFAALRTPLSPLEAVYFAVAATVGSAASIAPAGLGLSEGLAAGLASLVAVSPGTAFLAAALARVLVLASNGAIAGLLLRRRRG